MLADRVSRSNTATKFVLALLSLLLGSGLAISQPKYPLFYGIQSNSGLLSDRTTCTYQDHLGYLWIGTEVGLSRYTGTGTPRSGSFSNYVSDPSDSNSLSNDYITRIYQDSLLNLWIGTKSGLCLYDFEHDRFKRIQPGSPAQIGRAHV